MQIYLSPLANSAMIESQKICKAYRHEFIMPEHLLLALLEQVDFEVTLSGNGCDTEELRGHLETYLDETEKVPEDVKYTPEISAQLQELISRAYRAAEGSGTEWLKIAHITRNLLTLKESYAAFLLNEGLGTFTEDFMSELITRYEDIRETEPEEPKPSASQDAQEAPKGESWRSLVTCVNDNLEARNPLIGREQELERTIRVLCRKEKNNPLHVGEPGVGKTALVYGLARRINDGTVPERLRGSRIYMLDLGTLIAGTQFRGDFEKRIKTVMDGVGKEPGAIVYIDEIHNLVGAGATGESSMDASNMLKPYLEAGTIRFIGSTTYEEFNRHLARSKGLVRRFQQIDIAEPGIDETINIAQQLKTNYEQYHGVIYTDDAVEFAVRGSARHINDRFLPDKAIDLIDEAGAYREIHPIEGQARQTVDKELVAEILSKMCKVDTLAMKEDDNAALETLEKRVGERVYGQAEAVRCVTEAVQMAKAGLTDGGKPLASMLFVGPTGVGKTELARVLAAELGIELLRFDMSEYTEKHTVAKLIGAPAGYVGYEDGGLLTDAIRRTPNCVLLLDEIEKAHQDIYNVLLQVMDYARLTDNKGRRADFRNVILIMTSNAGAQYAAQASIGFAGGTSAGEAMLKQVKKTFKPEFINRLSATIVFNDMDRTMAALILDKKLSELQDMLSARKVEMTLTDEAREHLLQRGFTREYGAREIDRVITAELKPLLMREILFGQLKNGGSVVITIDKGQMTTNNKREDAKINKLRGFALKNQTMVFQLGKEIAFPDPRLGDPNGPLAVGGDLSVDRLLLAYKNGIFPWYAFKYSDEPMWYCPMRRFVIFPNEIHVSHSMRTLMNKKRYRLTFNKNFDGVIAECGRLRIKENGAWLGDDMTNAYKELHRRGFASSVEVWDGERLVGGLYGVTIGRAFFGESMFSLVPSASKLALIHLAHSLADHGGRLIDCQFETPHLKSMGGRYISYGEYMEIITDKAK